MPDGSQINCRVIDFMYLGYNQDTIRIQIGYMMDTKRIHLHFEC